MKERRETLKPVETHIFLHTAEQWIINVLMTESTIMNH